MFKLNIECTKDIDELHINFSDGSSVVTTVPTSKSKKQSDGTEQPKEQSKESKESVVHQKVQKQEAFLDTEADFGGISQEVVKPPQIEREEKGVNVAQELQNFDF